MGRAMGVLGALSVLLVFLGSVFAGACAAFGARVYWKDTSHRVRRFGRRQ
jgi:hypothetical protein